MKTGAQWVVQSLLQHGVTQVFGYPGGQIMPLYDALYDGGLEHILCRHEQGAAMAAIGYARATGKTGVCIATSGPGATNLLTGLADAMIDSAPIVAITGQVPRALIGTDAFQEVDILSMSMACTKHSFQVESIEALPDILEQAFIIANSGRPGPVLIDLPKDIQIASADFSCFKPQASRYTFTYPTVSPSALMTAKQLLALAHKPMLYVGGGVAMSDATTELRAFIDETGLPCVATLKGLGAPDYKQPYYLGLIGMHGSKAANLAVQACDLLIAVGVRFDDRVTGKLNEFAPNAKVIHLDIDPAEIGKLKQPHVALQGDIKAVLPILQQRLAIRPWQHQVSELKAHYCARYDHPGRAIYAPLLLKQLTAMLPDNSVVTTDVGQHQMWAAQHMHFSHPNNFITSSGLGTMGFGLPAAIGAQLARAQDCVVCVSGDGSILMNIQELGTVKRKQLPVKIVLLDNQRLGMVRQWQQLFFNARYSETDLSDNPDFLTLAKAFDIPGRTITDKQQVETAIQEMLDYPGAYLLHVAIDEMENVWPLVPPGASNETMLDSVAQSN